MIALSVRLASGSRTFWDWSPAKGRFKPKVEDRLSGKMVDPADTESFTATFKSKWTQVSQYYGSTSVLLSRQLCNVLSNHIIEYENVEAFFSHPIKLRYEYILDVKHPTFLINYKAMNIYQSFLCF